MINFNKDFNKLIITEDEKKQFLQEIKLKGEERYLELYNSIIKHYNNTKLTYETLTHYYRYDIKLRRALYKIISFIEIAMIATITNNYKIDKLNKNNFETQINKLFNTKINYKKIKTKVEIILNNKNMTLYNFLEKSDFEILNMIFLLVDKSIINEVFIYDTNLETNLNALRFVRNAVMHNYILINKNLKDVIISRKTNNSLQANIENIINLSPDKAKTNLKKLINDCLMIDENKGHISTNYYNVLDQYKVFFEGVNNEQ